MSFPPPRRLATSIFTRTGIKLHIKLNYLTLKHTLMPSLNPYPVSPRLKAVESMLSSPIVYKNQFCELRELVAGRKSMDQRQYFTVAPSTHQLTYIDIPNTDIPLAPATRLVNCTDTTVFKNTNNTILYFHGGAFVGGTVPSHAPFACHVSKSAQCNMYFLEYHNAPEYALELIKYQAIHSYQYMINTLNIKPHDIIFAGDSAGMLQYIACTLIINITQHQLTQLYVTYTHRWWISIINTTSATRQRFTITKSCLGNCTMG